MSASYSPGEVEKLLGVPSSTIRRYVQQFQSHFSPDARRLRGRRFLESDVHTVAQIRDLAQQGIRIKDIDARLGEVVQAPSSPEEPEGMPPQTALLVIQNLVAQQKQQEDAIIALEDRINALQAEIIKLNTPWWKRIGGR